MRAIFYVIVFFAAGNFWSGIQSVAGSEITKQAVFGHPNDKTIETKIIELIDDIDRNGQLKMAVYYIADVKSETGKRLSTALICAANRGVTIQILTEIRWVIRDGIDTNKDDNARAFIRKLNMPNPNVFKHCSDKSVAGKSDLFKEVQTNFCYFGCAWGSSGQRYEEAIQHNKFVIIKDQQKSYVLQGSSNFSKSQQNSFQDLVIFHNNSELFQVFNGQFDRMISFSNTHLPNAYFTKQLESIFVAFFPRGVCQDFKGDLIRDCNKSIKKNNSATDDVWVFLDKIDHAKPCKLHFNMYLWSTSSRARSLADKIVELSENGCEVGILGDAKHIYGKILKKLRQARNIKLTLVHKLHSKYFLFNGTSKQGKKKNTVWMGSHNFTNGSLRRNDETVLILDDIGIYNDYLKNWDFIDSQNRKQKEQAPKEENKTTWVGRVLQLFFKK